MRTPYPLAARIADAAPLTDADRVRLVAAETEIGGPSDVEALDPLASVIYPDTPASLRLAVSPRAPS